MSWTKRLRLVFYSAEFCDIHTYAKFNLHLFPIKTIYHLRKSQFYKCFIWTVNYLVTSVSSKHTEVSLPLLWLPHFKTWALQSNSKIYVYFLNLHFFNIYQLRRIRIVPLNLGTCSFGTFSCRLLGNLTVNTTETWQMKSIKMFYSILCECKGFLHILQDFSSMFLSKNILNILAKIAGRRWTWKTPTDVTKIKIDYILINRPDIVRDVTVINQVNIRSHQLRCECACVRLQTTW